MLQFGRIRLAAEKLGRVYVEFDVGEMRGRRNRYAAVVGGVLGVCSIFAFVMASRLQRLVSEPVLALVGIARAISQQKNYSLRAHSRGEDEVGLLITAFNHMLDQIEQRDRELLTHRAHLEEEVAERTADVRAVK